MKMYENGWVRCDDSGLELNRFVDFEMPTRRVFWSLEDRSSYDGVTRISPKLFAPSALVNLIHFLLHLQLNVLAH